MTIETTPAQHFAEQPFYDSSFPTDIPVQLFGRVANAALRKRGWNNILIEEGSRLVTATLTKTERRGGQNWQLEYTITIRWSDDDGLASPVFVEVAETRNSWTHEFCRINYELFLQDTFYCSRELLNEFEASFAKKKGARWATPDDLDAAGYLGNIDDGGNLILSGWPHERCFVRLPKEDTLRHTLVCGPTGSGKTTGIFIPNLIERLDYSAIVTEATGTKGNAGLYQSTAGYRQRVGKQRIYYLNPGDRCSMQFNPIDFIAGPADATNITEIIFNATTKKTHRGDQSWELSERWLLTALMMHAVSLRGTGKDTLTYCYQILREGVDAVEQEMSRTPIQEARDAYFMFINNSTEGYRYLVANGVASRIKVFNEPEITAMCAATTMDFEAMAKELFTIYIAVPASKPQYKPLAGLLLNLILDRVMPMQKQHPLMLMLDEFTNYGYVSGLPGRLSIDFRHDGVPCILGVQDFTQLELVYDREARLLISQPATKVFFRPNDYETAEQISKRLGIAIDESTRVNSSGQLQERDKREPLLSADQLMTLNTVDSQHIDPTLNEAIVFTPKTRPIRMKALTWREYQNETNPKLYPPPQLAPLPIQSGFTLNHQPEPRRTRRRAESAKANFRERQPKKPPKEPDHSNDW